VNSFTKWDILMRYCARQGIIVKGFTMLLLLESRGRLAIVRGGQPQKVRQQLENG
jgi:hypothetical protein